MPKRDVVRSFNIENVQTVELGCTGCGGVLRFPLGANLTVHSLNCPECNRNILRESIRSKLLQRMLGAIYDFQGCDQGVRVTTMMEFFYDDSLQAGEKLCTVTLRV